MEKWVKNRQWAQRVSVPAWWWRCLFSGVSDDVVPSQVRVTMVTLLWEFPLSVQTQQLSKYVFYLFRRLPNQPIFFFIHSTNIYSVPIVSPILLMCFRIHQVPNRKKSTSRLYIVTLLIQLICRVHHEKCWAGRSTSWNQIARRNTNNLRYADDTTLMAESEEELKSERGEWKSWLKA